MGFIQSMELYFIRHGQSQNNALWDRTGSNQDRSTDPELTGTGIQQALHLAKYLSNKGAKTKRDNGNNHNQFGFRITHLYSSLMVRAVATGTFISDALKIPLAGWLDIHEIGGIYQADNVSEERIGMAGKSRDFFNTNYPSFIFPAEANQTGWWNSLNETYEDAQIRAHRVFTTLMKNHGSTNDKVAIVSHAGFYNVFFNLLVNSSYPPANHVENPAALPQPQYQHWFLINNAAITRVDFLENNINLVYTNRTHHLPDALIT